MQGLEQATNALDDWFYLQTLSQGESGKLTLNVAFEGETEVNDYMDTNGSLDLKFAVELTRKDASATGPGNNSKKSSGVNSGDSSNLMLWTAFCAVAAALLLILALFSIRRDRKEAKSDEEA